jgi:DNA repair protein RecO (recombination protein O)
MPALSSDALVLRTYKQGETSKIVVLLTRERGKVRAIAKGARGPRSRYQSALEPLSEVRVSLYGRQGADLLRLGECELLHSAFPSGLEDALALSYYAELIDGFAQEGEVEDAVYRLALAVVRAAKDGGSVTILARYLEAWLLKLHGLYPPLDRCSGCGRPLGALALTYHSAARGFVCDDCRPASGPNLPEGARSLLEAFFRTAPAEVRTGPASDAACLEGFHQELIASHLERSLRSQRVLREVAQKMR